ncbi:glycoside hydrolase family 88 protein [Labilibacter marinus]|uniref:glycoside hydrolase family 88 protein n=1 Tax=Labilibacter marinus TaxID=1477105 RepID=UPI000829B3B1|nr:glycoside hydrolase family 88 protein [Labilibacter marinus]
MKLLKGFMVGMLSLSMLACQTKKEEEGFCDKNLKSAEQQTALLVKEAMMHNKLPRTLTAEGEMHWARSNFDWTEGFFPGVCWYLYEYSGNEAWKNQASELQSMFESHKTLTTNHDLGFVFNCSYGNAYRLTQNEAYKQVMIEAGNALITRFKPEVGCIKSWDVDGGWQAKRGWQYPVIIDNMMNLELLFELSELTKDDKYKEVAIAHANTTLKNHFRTDNSSYHVIDYDSINGELRNKHTAQGFAHESAWARGQAWGLYGYTVCYRYTKNPAYLQQAQKIAEFINNYEGMPSDHVPYWDYNAPKIPNEPRDASAAAVTASALIELSTYTDTTYLEEAKYILESLASDSYQAKLGENGKFVLKHSVGSIPHNNEIDVPLVYADYYYIEALMRLKKLEK